MLKGNAITFAIKWSAPSDVVILDYYVNMRHGVSVTQIMHWDGSAPNYDVWQYGSSYHDSATLTTLPYYNGQTVEFFAVVEYLDMHTGEIIKTRFLLTRPVSNAYFKSADPLSSSGQVNGRYKTDAERIFAAIEAQGFINQLNDVSATDPVAGSRTEDIQRGFQIADLLFFVTHGSSTAITNSFGQHVPFQGNIYPPSEDSIFLAILRRYFPDSGPIYYGPGTTMENVAPLLQVYYACGVVAPYSNQGVPQYNVADATRSPYLLMNSSYRLDMRVQPSLNIVGFDRSIELASCIPWTMYQSILDNIQQGNWSAAGTLVEMSYKMYNNGHFKILIDALGAGAGVAESVELANNEYMVSDNHMQLIRNDDGTFYLESSPVGAVTAIAPYIPENASSAGIYFVPLSKAEENRRKLAGKSLRVQILPGYGGQEIAW